jgi:hypothetical protein
VPLSPYRLFLPAAFAFTQRALADAAIFALEAALIFRLVFFAAGFVDRFDPFTFAHLALAAARILARPAALILRLGLAVLASVVLPPPSLISSFCSFSICSVIEAARRNCFDVRLIILMR